MLSNLKPLVVILALALLVFHFAKPVCLQFMSLDAFERRRNAWLGLTVIAFLSPTFWIFALCEFAILIRLGKKDENPLALFAIATFTIPNVKFYIPAPLINQFFDLTQYRLLSLALLVPAVLRLYKTSNDASLKRFGLLDTLLLGFILVQIVLPMPYESITNTMRRAFLAVLDIFLVVYAFQRLSTRKQLSDVLACYWLSMAIMAVIAIFEAFKGWLLYTGLGDAWGDPSAFSYLYRGSSLRAQAAAGHSINLGYQLAAGLGAFLYLWRPGLSRRLGWSIVAVFIAALIATGSRGAWVTAMIGVTLFVAFRPNAGRRLAGAAFTGVVILTLMYFSPLKESVIDRLPIIGTTDQDTIAYRQQLFEVSWQLIKLNPLFGDPFVVDRLESLRQGQGIIDIVNGYIYVALFNGLVALFFVVGGFVLAGGRLLLALVSVRGSNEEMATLGASLFSVLLAGMFYIGTAGIITTHYVFMGLAYSFWRVHSASARTAAVPFRERPSVIVRPGAASSR